MNVPAVSNELLEYLKSGSFMRKNLIEATGLTQDTFRASGTKYCASLHLHVLCP